MLLSKSRDFIGIFTCCNVSSFPGFCLFSVHFLWRGWVDFGQKNRHSSVFSRTLSASKLCRGDALESQIDENALKSVDTKSSTPKLSENQINRVMSVQKRMGELEEELKRAKKRLSLSEGNVGVNEALSPKKAGELIMQLESIKELLSDSRDELNVKDKMIESLETELRKTRRFELVLAEKDIYLDKLKEELRNVRQEEQDMMVLLSENNKRIQELEDDAEREKQLESKMAESFAVQTKQLEAAKIELEESKIEINSLRDRVVFLEEELSNKSSREEEVKSSSSEDSDSFGEEDLKGLVFELQTTKESLAHAQEGERRAWLKARSLFDEMELLKNELKMAAEVEEKSTKALEDLALALKEVATEANQAKEKVSFMKIELEHVKGEAKQLKKMLRRTEERYQKLLAEAKQEAELHKNTAERLRLEAEETILAWNGKEMGFVSCIKRAEEERAIAQQENKKLAESLEAAENMTRTAREETYKLRDILKQAVSEANAAKAAAGIARDENSQLKDSLIEKEEALIFLTRENERLRIREAAACEKVKELKRLLSTVSPRMKTEDKKNNIEKTFSFNPEDLKFMTEPEDFLDEDHERAEALRGSMLDETAEFYTPKSVFSHHRGYSSAFTDDERMPNSVSFDHSDCGHIDDSDTDGNANKRMKTMFQRVGDLLMVRRSFQRKEPSTGKTIVTQP